MLSMRLSPFELEPATVSECKPGSPGWISRASDTPRRALNIDVDAKYTKVLRAILPFILALMLALPVIKLAITSGRIISFRIRMKISPG